MQTWISLFHTVLRSKGTYRILIGVNVLVALAIMVATWGNMLSDGWSYLGLAEGIIHGEYSMWWPMEEDYPDTFRMPGYPLLIAGSILVFGTWKSMFLLQFVMYVLALVMTLTVIARCDPRLLARNLFLLLLIPMVNVPFYISQLYTEIPVLLCISASMAIITMKGPRQWWHYMLLGLIYGVLFQMRPVFLLFPFLHVSYSILRNREARNIKANLSTIVVFVLTLIPYGSWNLKNHGVFRITPLEGSGYYVHFAHWSGLMPGYTEHVYWHNFTGDEMIRFVSADSIASNVAAYEQEWAEINAQLEPLLTAKDSAMKLARMEMPYRPSNSFNTEYTIKRESMLFEKGLHHLFDDPIYTISQKAYTAVRLWVIGVQRSDFISASPLGKVKALFATLMTTVVFLLFIVLLPLEIKRKAISVRAIAPLLAFTFYFWLMHLPFTIQTRYTVPVRFAMLALTALAIAAVVLGRYNESNRRAD